MLLPCVRFPPFSKKLYCYENCKTHAFKPYTDGIEKYISIGVDLKVQNNKSISDYEKFIKFIEKKSNDLWIESKERFALHMSNEVIFDENEIVTPLQIDDDFELLFFDILNLFNKGQPFELEFEYKIKDRFEVNLEFLHKLVNYTEDNKEILFNGIIIARRGKDGGDLITVTVPLKT